jgi:hypothetical protein
MSREDYPGVKPGTLNRFAKGKGNYIPVDDDLLIALGLKKPRKARQWNQERSIVEAMAQMVGQALRWKKRRTVK